ncbi:hypothetical protein PHMEG_00020443, partial [Phytophthora megakarya]
SSSDSEPLAENVRPRPKWIRVWNSLLNTDSTSGGHYDLSHTTHNMRTILTKCKSAMCAWVKAECGCRYKINTCESTQFITVGQEGIHCMENQCDITSPRTAKGLTSEMKTIVHDALQQNTGIAPHVVFGRICSKIAGPPPLESQVQGYMRRWRDKNRDDSMAPVIEICSESMFERVQTIEQSGGALLVFCDPKWENNQYEPKIGDASDCSPFRIGQTSY